MPSLFIDSSAWVAALVPRESRHAEARDIYVRAAATGVRLVTTPLVVAETHALILRASDPRRGARFLETAFDAAAHAVLPLADDLLTGAIERWIRRFTDKPFSLCDAVSFEVMRLERLVAAFTFDHHFRVAGYQTVPAR